MIRLNLFLGAAALATLIGAAARADTLVVDSSAGPFFEITDAVAAALDGDVILVRSGSYQAFSVVDLELSILGDTCVIVNGTVTINALAAGKRLVLSELQVGCMELSGCAGSVLADNVQAEIAEIEFCDDVRLHQCEIDPNSGSLEGRTALRVTEARLEVSDCFVSGETLMPMFPGGQSGDGLFVQSARVHISGSDIWGGSGAFSVGPDTDGGDGGDGVRATLMSDVLIAGALDDSILGGAKGEGTFFDGSPGSGLSVFTASMASVSGVSLLGGFPDGAPVVGSVTFVDPPAPSLKLVDAAGFRFRIFAEPGSIGRLRVGFDPIVVPSGLTVESLVLPLRSYPFGPVPASGSLDMVVPELGFFPIGTVFIQQAFLLSPGLTADLTNSVTFKRHEPLFGPDCNNNCVPDALDPDCNQNGLPDACDISAGTSEDGNLNGIPDECETDCNQNGVPDDLDIASGNSRDCNANLVPDECDLANQIDSDCNQNGVPDGCEQGWFLADKLVPDNVSDTRAGGALAISGPTLVEGPGNNFTSQHVVRTYRRTSAGWILESTIASPSGASGSADTFGAVVAVADRTLLSGSFSSAGEPEVYVYTRGATGNFVLEATLTSGSPNPADGFGRDLAMADGTIAVGVPFDSQLVNEAGAVNLYEENAQGQWTKIQTLTALNPTPIDRLGNSVAMSPGLLVVGSMAGSFFPGSVYVFERGANGVWSQLQKLLPPNPQNNPRFGAALAVTPTRLAVGAPFDDSPFEISGSVTVFQRGPNGWIQSQQIDAPAPESFAQFGSSVSLLNNRLVIGAPSQAGTGAAYAYTESNAVWALDEDLTPADTATFDRYGEAVLVTGPNEILVGVPRDDPLGSTSTNRDYGAIQVFDFEPDLNGNGVPDECE